MSSEELKSSVRVVSLVLGVAVMVFGLVFGLMKLGGYLFDTNKTDEQIARDAFIETCQDSRFGQRVGVPNVSKKPWTCEIPLGTTR